MNDPDELTLPRLQELADTAVREAYAVGFRHGRENAQREEQRKRLELLERAADPTRVIEACPSCNYQRTLTVPCRCGKFLGDDSLTPEQLMEKLLPRCARCDSTEHHVSDCPDA